jgi:multidrug efflux pump subunit AcrA (membrane-fusion protein)
VQVDEPGDEDTAVQADLDRVTGGLIGGDPRDHPGALDDERLVVDENAPLDVEDVRTDEDLPRGRSLGHGQQSEGDPQGAHPAVVARLPAPGAMYWLAGVSPIYVLGAMTPIQKRLFAAVPLLIGVAALVIQNLTRSEAPEVSAEEIARPMRVLTLAPRTVTPRVTGYGTAQAARTWRAVARVEGRITELNEALQSGGRIRAGEMLVALEEAPLQLEITRIEAEIARLEAELRELGVREDSDRTSLAIEEDSLELAEAELQRLEALVERGAVSTSDVDSTRRTVLAQRQSVQGLSASLALAPVQRSAKEASLGAQRASLDEARLELSYTRVVAPFDLVLGEVGIGVDQFVARGELLFEAYGIREAVVDAEFLYGEARRLIGPEAAQVITALQERGEPRPEELGRLFQAKVRVVVGERRVDWDARVTGMREFVSSTSRALSLRVAVEEPYDKAQPGVRPPLLQGTFCEVTLAGLALPDRLVVPRGVIRNDSVWVLDEEDRLRSVPVVVDFQQGEAAVIGSGLQAGQRILVADSGPALAGSLVAPQEDSSVAERLAADVAGATE